MVELYKYCDQQGELGEQADVGCSQHGQVDERVQHALAGEHIQHGQALGGRLEELLG